MPKLSISRAGTIDPYLIISNVENAAYNGTTYVVPSAANWTTLARELTNLAGTNIWEATFPVLAAGIYTVRTYDRAVALADATPDDQEIGQAVTVTWSGTAFTSGTSSAEIVAAVEAEFGPGPYTSTVPPSAGYCNLTDTFIAEPGATVFFQLLNATPLTDAAIYDDSEQSVNVSDAGALTITNKLVREKRYRFRCDRFPGEYQEFIAEIPDEETCTMRELMGAAE
jgi:hypothetical protein